MESAGTSHWRRFSQWVVVFGTGWDFVAPLILAFPTSDSSGLLFNDSPAHPDMNPALLASFDPVPSNLPNTNPTAQSSTPVLYDPLHCM